MLASLLVPSLVWAFNFQGKTAGRFIRERNPNRAVMIHPDRVKFRFCRKAKIMARQLEADVPEDHNGEAHLSFFITLFTRGDDDAQCLPRGFHTCRFTWSHWNDQPDQLYLAVMCSRNFIQFYHKRLH